MAKTKAKNKASDLKDSPKDEQKLKTEETTIDMPDVKDIPGQEHVRPPRMKEFNDVTISSDDEEGKGIWDEDETDDESNVTSVEKKLLDQSANDMPATDDQQLRKAELDNTDDDGDPLNEGTDLDIPGAEQDDDNEEIGEEDEENNSYSLGGDSQSINEERSGT